MVRAATLAWCGLAVLASGLAATGRDDPQPKAPAPNAIPKMMEKLGANKEVFPALKRPKGMSPGNPGMRGRGADAKSETLQESGGNEASERAVAMGLGWLARQQRADGFWVFDGSSKEELTASTGLALLAFLGAGESHVKAKKYQESVYRGLNWLVTHLKAEGKDAGKFYDCGVMYSQAIGALALCEAYALTEDEALQKPAQAAINFIQSAQRDNGSWGYVPGLIGDTSIAGWQIQALYAARQCKDLTIAGGVWKRADAFLFSVSADQQSAFGYLDRESAQPATALSASGLLSRYYIKNGKLEGNGMAKGVEAMLAKRLPEAGKPLKDLYFYYYATQVIRYHGGEPWNSWNAGPKQPDGVRRGGVRDFLIGLQLKKDGADQGCWDPEQGLIGKPVGRLGTTALCVLTLEVYYRYPLPESK